MNWMTLFLKSNANHQNLEVAFLMMRTLTAAKPAEEPKRTKHRELTPELTEESSIDSIQEVEADTSISSIEESFIQQSAQKKPRGRPTKVTKAEQPSKVKATPLAKGVKGRKPKLAVVPETQVEVSIVEEEEEEEEEVDEIEMAPRRRMGSVLPASMTRKAYEVWVLRGGCLIVATCEEGSGEGITNARGQEFCFIQRNGRETIQKYHSTVRKWELMVAADDLIADLTAQVGHQKDSVKPSQIKELESKGSLNILGKD
jgi:hypothetical protein